jgi:tetratricopeptide (TPR) repeat protein
MTKPHLDKGEVDQALGYLHESAAISQQLKDAQGEMGAYYALAKYFYKVGEYAHALKYAHKVLDLEARVERSRQPAYAEAIIGRIECRRENRDEGIARLLKAAHTLEDLGVERRRPARSMRRWVRPTQNWETSSRLTSIS